MGNKNLNTVTAKSEWLAFSNQCLKGCSDVQITEMQKAFYAGITSALSIMTSIPGDFTETEYEAVFKRVFTEAESVLAPPFK